MDEFDYRQCPECSERIPHTAKRCPFCKSLQGKRKWMNNSVLLGMMPVLTVMVFSFINHRSLTDKPNYFFVDYVKKVPVTSSEMHFETSKNRCQVSILGTIRNDTDIPWQRPAMEVQFYDKTGKLIDVVESFYSSITLMPHQEQAFRISDEASRPVADYATHKVLLRHANDAYHFSR